MSKLQIKMLLTIALLGLSFYFMYPTFEWYRMPQQEREQREKMKDKILNKILNLGLDLRGGIHLVLELDATKIPQGIEVGDAVDRAIEIIRNRIDQFGVAEPLIARQGDRWIVVQLPGIKNPERAKDLIGRTALLEFRIVENNPALSDIIHKMQEKGIQPEDLPKYPEIAKLVPPGMQLFTGKEERYYLLKSTPELTGATLVNAKVELGGEFGYPHVSLEFNKEGAKVFAAVTEANVERNLAIVLDGVVQSAPVIRTRIPDGKAIIEGNFSMDEAKLLATVLRAGALPAPVKIIEEVTVGPTLGEDSIRAGVIASLTGLLLVIIFMLVYYRFSGLIADFALTLNFILLIGVMAYLHSTLTLPGIAGIILSLGMAVDANVLILERVRDELHAGKTPRLAIDAGYQKAFSAILDSNLTTLIAALFLFQFGTGPVKGFAVTLTLGIVISMFTAITVTKMIYDLLFQERIIHDIKF
jgi:protein-export membrane protein SecD